ncbi:MAG TPA: hypothetical protein VF158_15070 [Longimicrobiales bacterium]
MKERRILRRKQERRALRTAGLVMLIIGAIAALGALLVRDQISRHRRDLFSPQPLRRLAALGFLAGLEPSVDVARLLHDYVAWETRPLLRKRAEQILARMERRLAGTAPTAGGAAG